MYEVQECSYISCIATVRSNKENQVVQMCRYITTTSVQYHVQNVNNNRVNKRVNYIQKK